MDVQTNAPIGIPERFPANGQDWANHMAAHWSASVHLQAVLEFDRHLDAKLIEKAVRLSVDAEPVLGCRFVEASRAYWQRLDQIDQIEWCRCQQTFDLAGSIVEWLQTLPDADSPLVQAILLQADDHDALCLRLHHACADGGGMKDYITLLSQIYTELTLNPQYQPNPNLGERSARQVFAALGCQDPRLFLDRRMVAQPPAAGFPYHGGGADRLRIQMRRLDCRQLASLHSYARQHNATINDVLLTAYYRALFAMLSLAPGTTLDIHVTVDLRCYLTGKKAAAICNLSGMLNTSLACTKEQFSGTLGMVVSIMQKLKGMQNPTGMQEMNGAKPGLHSAAAMEMLGAMDYQAALALMQKSWQQTLIDGKCAPLLSNLGVIAPYPLRFASCRVQSAYVVTPAIQPPGFMLGVSTYHDELTICAGCLEPAADADEAARLLDLITAELLLCTEDDGKLQ